MGSRQEKTQNTESAQAMKQHAWLHIQILQLSSCVTLEKLLNLSEIQLSPCKMGIIPFSLEYYWEEIMNIKHLAQWLTPSDHSIKESYYWSIIWLQYRWSASLINDIFSNRM